MPSRFASLLHARTSLRSVRALTPWCVALGLALVLGCSSGHTAVIQLRTDLAPGLDFDAVVVRSVRTSVRDVSVRDDFRRPVQVDSVSGIQTGELLTVVVELRRDGDVVVDRRVMQTIASDAIVPVIITRNCIEIACPSASEPDATECQDGVCVTPDCAESGTCGSTCTRAAECSTTVACVVPDCVSGACLATPDSSRCAAGEVCSPVAGCVPIEVSDAGASDAGVPDASGPDAAVAPFSVRYLPPASTSWNRWTIFGDAPTVPVEAVFASEGIPELIVLTHDELFVYDISSIPTFTERKPRHDVFPELDGVTLQDAYAIGTTLLISATDSWIYDWAHTSRTAVFRSFVDHDDLGADWDGPLAPPWWDMVAAYYMPSNINGWAQPDAARSPCGSAAVGNHVVFLSTDGFGPAEAMVSVYDGACAQFVYLDTYGQSSYAPFAYGNAPAPFAIQAMEWNAGLWAFVTP